MRLGDASVIPMTTFSIDIDIRASPERVWAVLSDVERWHEWTPSIIRIERLDSGPLAVGSRARVHQPRLPVNDWQVIALEEGKGFTWIAVNPGVRVTAQHRIEPTDRGSRVLLSTNFEGILGAVVGRLTRELNERYLRFEANGLKDRSENHS